MHTVLVILTVIEIALVLGVVAVYLYLVGKSLAISSRHLSKVAFGVRAIEAQAAPIGIVVPTINNKLTGIASALDGIATMAESAADSRPLGG